MKRYKLFFGEVQILIFSGNHYSSSDEKESLIINTPDQIAGVIDSIKKNKLQQHVLILSPKPDEVFRLFKESFVYRKAAGGLVTNNSGETLFIYKRGFWDLPKGNVDKKETYERTAVREVTEECGVNMLELFGQRCITYHIGWVKGKLILKKTVWFDMFCSDPENIRPEQNEGITEVKWVKKLEINEHLDKSYLSIREVINKK